MPVTKIVERPVYKDNIIRREVPKIVKQEVIYETTIPVEKVNVIEEVIEVPIDRIVERPVTRQVVKYVEMPTEKIIEEENEIEQINYVEKITHVKVERIQENPIFKEKIVERPLMIEKIVEKEVDVPIEKIIEVPVEKIVEVPVEIIIDNPIVVQKEVVKEVYYDRNVPNIIHEQSKSAGVHDHHYRSQIETTNQMINQKKLEIAKLKAEFEIM